MPIHVQGRYWGIAALLFFVALWYLGSVMLPFLIGGAVAYFLDPVADRMQRWGLSRVAATSLITIGALLILVLLVLAVIPVLVQQLTALINAAPEIANRLQTFVVSRFPELTDSTSVARQTLAKIAAEILGAAGSLLRRWCRRFWVWSAGCCSLSSCRLSRFICCLTGIRWWRGSTGFCRWTMRR